SSRDTTLLSTEHRGTKVGYESGHAQRKTERSGSGRPTRARDTSIRALSPSTACPTRSIRSGPCAQLRPNNSSEASASPGVTATASSAAVRNRAASRCRGRKGSPCSSVTTSVSASVRSEEHTSELQSRFDLVCRLLLEKNKHPA